MDEGVGSVQGVVLFSKFTWRSTPGDCGMGSVQGVDCPQREMSIRAGAAAQIA